MAKRLTEAEILAQIPGARADGKRVADQGLLARSVRYNRPTKRFFLELSNGVLLGIPVASLPELASATFAQLARVELSSAGGGLRLAALDVDYSVPGLVLASIGRAVAARAFAQTGGLSVSAAKADAARANGAKGGRPRRGADGVGTSR